MSIILAVVGSVKFERPEAPRLACAIIAAVVDNLQPDRLVSGGAIGVDTWAREVGEQLGYWIKDGNFIEHLPVRRRWAPDGFKDRNELVAQECTHLLAIRCHASKTYGSGWTADYAARLGRVVYRVTL